MRIPSKFINIAVATWCSFVLAACGPSKTELRLTAELKEATTQIKSLRQEVIALRGKGETTAKQTSEIEQRLTKRIGELEGEVLSTKVTLDSELAQKSILIERQTLLREQNAALQNRLSEIEVLRKQTSNEAKAVESNIQELSSLIENAIAEFSSVVKRMRESKFDSPGLIYNRGSILKRNGYDDSLRAPFNEKENYVNTISRILDQDLQKRLRLSLYSDIDGLVQSWASWKSKYIQYSALESLLQRTEMPSVRNALNAQGTSSFQSSKSDFETYVTSIVTKLDDKKQSVKGDAR